MYYKERWTTFRHMKLNFVIRTLIASDFVIWSSINLVQPIFAIFISDRISGASIETIGFATMVYLIAKSLVEIPLGIMIDRTKSEMDDLYVAIGGTIIVGLVYFMYSYVSNVWELYFLQALLGIGTAGAFPGWYAIFTRHIDEAKHGVAWSTHDVLLGVGGAIAAGLGAISVEKFGFGLVFNCVGVLVIAGALMLLLVRQEIFVKK